MGEIRGGGIEMICEMISKIIFLKIEKVYIYKMSY